MPIHEDTDLASIISEITIIRKNLKHPNIVKYLKTFKKKDNFYIVMEIIEGMSLSQRIHSLKERSENFVESKIWNIFIQILLALKYLHKDKNIVHRDLTPNNVMLSDNDKVTITDFGLAKLKGVEYCKITSIVGNLMYLCPENIKNEASNEKADIWSLGCILYELSTLEAPFSSSNMLSLASKVTNTKL